MSLPQNRTAVPLSRCQSPFLIAQFAFLPDLFDVPFPGICSIFVRTVALPKCRLMTSPFVVISAPSEDPEPVPAPIAQEAESHVDMLSRAAAVAAASVSSVRLAASASARQVRNRRRSSTQAREAMKYILVTGGVISGVGKGVIASSFGTLLKSCGIDVTSIKIDPYINIDAGTFSPYEHGK